MSESKKIYDVKKINLRDLEETYGNPQAMTEKEYAGLVKSIKSKGFILDDPVVWEYDENKFRIISGHHRIKAAIECEYTELNCKVIAGITEKQARLLVIEANQRRGELDTLNLERYLQDILSDFTELNLDIINDEIGVLQDIEIPEIESDLQKESESLKLTIKFKSFEEKEQFCEILDYYGGRGRSINDKVKQFVNIFLRDQKKKDEEELQEENT